MMAALAFVLMLTGFIAVAASMSRHRQQLGSEQFTPKQLVRWRIIGYLLLTASLAPCLLRWNPSIALALWCALLTPAALTLGLWLTYAPGWTRRLNVIATLSNQVYRR